MNGCGSGEGTHTDGTASIQPAASSLQTGSYASDPGVASALTSPQGTGAVSFVCALMKGSTGIPLPSPRNAGSPEQTKHTRTKNAHVPKNRATGNPVTMPARRATPGQALGRGREVLVGM